MGGRDHSCDVCGRGGFNDPDGVCVCPKNARDGVAEALKRAETEWRNREVDSHDEFGSEVTILPETKWLHQADAALAEVLVWLGEWLQHDAWRCEHPDRYPQDEDCCCGLLAELEGAGIDPERWRNRAEEKTDG
jgi:hypothetical protein